MFTDKIGYDWQWRTAGTCGKHAVRHALLAIGIPFPPTDVSRATGWNWLRTCLRGVNERRLIRAVEKLGARATPHHYFSRGETRRALDAALSRGNALVVCVDDGDHWVAICGRFGGGYIWVDSANADLVGSSPWTELADWMELTHKGEAGYYAIEVAADARPARLGSAVPRFARVWDAMLEDDVLRGWWGTYYQWAEYVFGRGTRGRRLDARRLCARYANYLDDDDQLYELERLAAVASAHGLSVAASRESAAMARLDEAIEALCA